MSEGMTSLICTSCAHGSHLSCRQRACECPCRQSVPILHEMSADMDEQERAS